MQTNFNYNYLVQTSENNGSRWLDRDSSSVHVINSDYPMTGLQKMGYVFFNFVSNVVPTFRFNKVSVTKFRPTKEQILESASQRSAAVSPSRFLCDLFWDSLDWEKYEKELNQPINILEVGCGTGRYAKHISRKFSFSSYTGIDIREYSEWRTFGESNVTFIKGSYEDLLELATDQNVIITQSALEHFVKDKKFFKNIDQYASKRSEKTLAIHIFPSAICLVKFLFHGIRQYNLRTILNLVNQSGVTPRVRIFALGGVHSNYFHFVRITLRSVIHKQPISTLNPKDYFSDLGASALRDSLNNSTIMPSFYALEMFWDK